MKLFSSSEFLTIVIGIKRPEEPPTIETTEATGILHKDGVISDHFIKLWVKHIF